MMIHPESQTHGEAIAILDEDDIERVERAREAVERRNEAARGEPHDRA